MTLERILQLIQEQGDLAYTAIFSYVVGSNSLLLPLFAGYAINLETFSWGKLVVSCWAGSFVGDTVRFWIGRRWGRDCVKFVPMLESRIDTLIRLINTHYLWMIMIHRFPHGIRHLAGFVYGITALPWPRFLVLNFIAAGLWAVLLVSIGYSFGHLSKDVLGDAASGASFGLVIVFLGLAWYLARKLDQAVERR